MKFTMLQMLSKMFECLEKIFTKYQGLRKLLIGCEYRTTGKGLSSTNCPAACMNVLNSNPTQAKPASVFKSHPRVDSARVHQPQHTCRVRNPESTISPTRVFSISSFLFSTFSPPNKNPRYLSSKSYSYSVRSFPLLPLVPLSATLRQRRSGSYPAHPLRSPLRRYYYLSFSLFLKT